MVKIFIHVHVYGLPYADSVNAGVSRSSGPTWVAKTVISSSLAMPYTVRKMTVIVDVIIRDTCSS